MAAINKDKFYQTYGVTLKDGMTTKDIIEAVKRQKALMQQQIVNCDKYLLSKKSLEVESVLKGLSPEEIKKVLAPFVK